MTTILAALLGSFVAAVIAALAFNVAERYARPKHDASGKLETA